MEEAKVPVTGEERVESIAAAKEPMQNIDSGEVVLVTSAGIRRIPIPTNDPNDPLNFPKWRKIGAIATCCWFSLFALLGLTGLTTFFNSLFQMYSPAQTPDQIVGLNTYPTMVMTVGALILMPASLVIGRRPVFLFAVVLLLVCTIISGASQSFETHLIGRIFAGLATGSTESILPLIITDVTFLDERNFYFGIYWSVQNCVNAAILISLPHLIAVAGWRWYYWFFAILIGASVIFVVLFVPETKYWRSPRSINGDVVFTDEFGDTHVISDAEARERFGTLQEVTVSETQEKKSFLQELKPWSDVHPNGWQTLLGAYVKIGQAATSPAVLYALMLTSMTLGIAIAITIVYSTILETQYGWSPESVGLFNIGTIPACFAAMFYAGFGADKINIWLAKRNNGIHKCEHHLIPMIPAVLAAIIGIVAVAVCANDPQTHSVWGIVVGWAIYQFAFTSIMITGTTLAAEAIPESPGAAIVVIVGGKSLISFGAAQGIVPMVAKYNYLTSFMILLGVFVAIAMLGIPVYFLNSKWRKLVIKKAST